VRGAAGLCARKRRLARLNRLYFFDDLSDSSRHLQIVVVLQIQPKVRCRAERLTQAQGGVGCDVHLLRCDPLNACSRNVHRAGERASRQLAWSLSVSVYESSVVVCYFNVCRSFRNPFEARPELVINPDRVLSSPITFQGFRPVAGRCFHIGRYAEAFLEPQAFLDRSASRPAKLLIVN
jgi:hypothetical protein